MNNYNFKYYLNQYIIKILILFWIIIFSTCIYVIFRFNIINNSVIKTVFIICFIIISLILILYYGLKLFSKNVNAIVFDNYIDINHGEKIIYFKNITALNLQTIKDKRFDLITGYILNIQYDNNKNIKYYVYAGTSKKEKMNEEYLLNFCIEISKIWNNGVSSHSI